MKKILFIICAVLFLMPASALAQAGGADNPNLECRCALNFHCNDKEECVPDSATGSSSSGTTPPSSSGSTTQPSTPSPVAQPTTSPTTSQSSLTTAKNDFGISNVKDVKLPNQTPAVYIGTIIRWVLGVLGIILIGMIVYGGVTYATAAGNDERAGTAKKIITYAIIGTVIVIAAAIISQFVLNTLFADPATGSALSSTSSPQAAQKSPTTAASATISSAGKNTSKSTTTGGSTTPSSSEPTSAGTGNSNTNTAAPRLPNKNPHRGLASLCNPQSTSCEAGLTCLKDPASPQYACLKKKGSTCNTNTVTAIGTNGCQFGTRCVKKSDPINNLGIPDGSLDNGRCE